MARPKSTARAEVRDTQRAWLRQIVRDTGKSLTQIASEAQVSHTTLTRFDRPDYSGTLNTLTVQQIAEAMGVEPPGGINPAELPVRRAGLQRDAEPFAMNDDTDPRGAVKALIGNRAGAAPFRMRTRALELRGYLPGDVLIVDMNADPREGDIVCAQVYDFSGNAETVMRVYEKLVLTAATLDAELQKPLLVDGERVVVMGVVTDMVRTRSR
ncbi:Uncharacterised protein [Starkeya nomas]|uniref:Uncharacterized protein n=1 Tax=Starkeya nomas TaxID=2666134 RepID=A0A5S9NZ18_9HYPH|nr:Uncharacterised protein [Starkeya nomas]